MNHKLLALYGLKFNPFSPELPVDAIHVPAKIKGFVGALSMRRSARVALP